MAQRLCLQCITKLFHAVVPHEPRTRSSKDPFPDSEVSHLPGVGFGTSRSTKNYVTSHEHITVQLKFEALFSLSGGFDATDPVQLAFEHTEGDLNM